LGSGGGRASVGGSGLLPAAAAGFLRSSSWEERKIIFVFLRELIELISGAHVHLSKYCFVFATLS
jgi:hypothetical protein